ncbi:MAG: acyl transferase [Bacteroidia bacterium]|nr:acyl transferase [Bacteroidia bacterium]
MSFTAEKIFSIKSENDFLQAAMAVFKYQASHCLVYREFVELAGIDYNSIKRIEDVPFLPIEFFKTHKVLSLEKKEEVIFLSSGTMGAQLSRHFIGDVNLYIRSFETCFESFYNRIENYCLLALLPSYLEREHSSLVFMVNHLIKKSGHPESSFYLDNYEKLCSTLKNLIAKKKKIILLGVSYALLDFAEQFPIALENTIVMETGGMKGRREEITREELHQRLCKSFSVSTIHSEYGMTELLSQAYSDGNGIFKSPSWMKIILRNPDDPFDVSKQYKTGIINVIDLANIYSCSFIATQDMGKMFDENKYEVLGRTDYSDLRGCNLMISDI